MGTYQGGNKFCHNRQSFPGVFIRKSLRNNSLQRFPRRLGIRISRETVISQGRTSPCGRPNPDWVLSHPSTFIFCIQVGIAANKPSGRTFSGPIFR